MSLKPPLTRGDCLPGGSSYARPCPYRRCRYHLLYDDYEGVKRVPEGLRLEAREAKREEGNIEDSCALDLADTGGKDPIEVARALGVSRQAINQIEDRAVRKLSKRLWLVKGDYGY